MALLLANKTYLKLELDGQYYIFKNKTARNKLKKYNLSQEIILKYTEILNNLFDPELGDYDYNASSEIQKWSVEYQQYLHDLSTFTVGNKYPLMEQYYPDISKSIPEVVRTGRLAIKADTLEELYDKVKRYNVFGPAEEITDV